MYVLNVCISSWVLYPVNKDKSDEFLPLLTFWRDDVNAILLEYAEEARSSSSHVGIRNFPIEACYDGTKYY